VPWRSEAFKKIYNFRWASMVGVPIAKGANTLVSRLRWVASSYVGRLDTKTTSSRSACLSTEILQHPGMFTALPT
jgi:hypothetical protein